MANRLQGKIAIVTGSDSGIGQATAEEFAKEGADVVVTYLEDQDGAKETRPRHPAPGGGGGAARHRLPTPAARADGIARMFEQSECELGAPYVTVNNAGIDSTGKPVAEIRSRTGTTR